MNEIQALNILTNLSTKALKNGLYENISEAGTVYNAILVLSQFMPQQAAEDKSEHHTTVEEIDGEPLGDPQGDSE